MMGRRKVGRDETSFLPLALSVFHILVVLADGEAHGYAIMQEVAARSNGSVRLGPGTLYGAISRLLKDGLIEESDVKPGPSDDPRRRYYRLTNFGQRVLTAEIRRMEELVRLARATKTGQRMKPA